MWKDFPRVVWRWSRLIEFNFLIPLWNEVEDPSLTWIPNSPSFLLWRLKGREPRDTELISKWNRFEAVCFGFSAHQNSISSFKESESYHIARCSSTSWYLSYMVCHYPNMKVGQRILIEKRYPTTRAPWSFQKLKFVPWLPTNQPTLGYEYPQTRTLMWLYESHCRKGSKFHWSTNTKKLPILNSSWKSWN